MPPRSHPEKTNTEKDGEREARDQAPVVKDHDDKNNRKQHSRERNVGSRHLLAHTALLITPSPPIHLLAPQSSIPDLSASFCSNHCHGSQLRSLLLLRHDPLLRHPGRAVLPRYFESRSSPPNLTGDDHRLPYFSLSGVVGERGGRRSLENER